VSVGHEPALGGVHVGLLVLRRLNQPVALPVADLHLAVGVQHAPLALLPSVSPFALVFALVRVAEPALAVEETVLELSLVFTSVVEPQFACAVPTQHEIRTHTHTHTQVRGRQEEHQFREVAGCAIRRHSRPDWDSEWCRYRSQPPARPSPRSRRHPRWPTLATLLGVTENIKNIETCERGRVVGNVW
jgi:hypothetical protein